MGFDPGVAQEAALLTAIGMGTAFAVLLVLLVMTLLIRLTSVRINGVTAEPTEDPPSQPTPEDAEGPQDEAEARLLAERERVEAAIRSIATPV